MRLLHETVRFHPEADAEMVKVAAWYEAQQEGLVKRFLTAVQDALNRIDLNPELYPLVEWDVRRCLAKTFPFGIFFRIKPDIIAIVAVMHLGRDPDCWKTRRFEQGNPGD